MKYLLFVTIILSLCSCAKDTESFNYSVTDQRKKIELPHSAEPPSPTSLEPNTKLIRSGKVTLESDDILQSREILDALLKKHKAFVTSEQYTASSYEMYYNLEVKIEGAAFDDLVTVLRHPDWKIIDSDIGVQDVSEEYLDLNIRVENKLAVLEQYRSILKKAKKIEEILQVQEKIRWIEEEIESAKGRLLYLDSKIKYATLHIHLQQPIEEALAMIPSFSDKMKSAVTNGWEFVLVLIIIILSLWPIWVFGTLGFFGYKRYKIKPYLKDLK